MAETKLKQNETVSSLSNSKAEELFQVSIFIWPALTDRQKLKQVNYWNHSIVSSSNSLDNTLPKSEQVSSWKAWRRSTRAMMVSMSGISCVSLKSLMNAKNSLKNTSIWRWPFTEKWMMNKLMNDFHVLTVAVLVVDEVFQFTNERLDFLEWVVRIDVSVCHFALFRDLSSHCVIQRSVFYLWRLVQSRGPYGRLYGIDSTWKNTYQ